MVRSAPSNDSGLMGHRIVRLLEKACQFRDAFFKELSERTCDNEKL